MLTPSAFRFLKRLAQSRLGERTVTRIRHSRLGQAVDRARQGLARAGDLHRIAHPAALTWLERRCDPLTRLRILTDCRAVCPPFVHLLSAIIRCHEDREDFRSARDELFAALSVHPGRAPLRARLASALTELGQFDLATEALDRAATQSAPVVIAARVELLAAQGQRDAALAWIEALWPKMDKKSSLASLALRLMQDAEATPHSMLASPFGQHVRSSHEGKRLLVRDLLDEKGLDHVRQLALTDRDPCRNPATLLFVADACREDYDLDTAVILYRKILAKNRDNLHAYFGLSKVAFLLEQYDVVSAIAEHLLARHPYSPRPVTIALETQARARRWHAAKHLLDRYAPIWEMHRVFIKARLRLPTGPGHSRYFEPENLTHIRQAREWHPVDGDLYLEEAAQLAGRGHREAAITMLAHPPVGLTRSQRQHAAVRMFRLRDTIPTDHLGSENYEVADELHPTLAAQAVHTGNTLLIRQHLSYLKENSVRKNKDVTDVILYVTALILLDMHTLALAEIADIPPRYFKDSDVAHLRAWAAAKAGDIEEARRIFAATHRSDPKVADCLEVSGPLTCLRLPPSDPNLSERIILIACAYNEADRIPDFLRHYRKLGVRSFIFIDNGSTDETRALLFAQPDCGIYSATGSYAKNCHGISWVNQLLGRLRPEQWCLHVDLDELLVYPGMEVRSIDHLVADLDNNGAEAMRGFMLDMHGGELGVPAEFHRGDSMLERCPFFVPAYEFRPAVSAPYVSVSGGLRETALAMRAYLTPLVKTPLVRAGKGIIFWSSSHKISPARMANMSCALLHFKFIGDFLKRAKAEVIRGQHARGAGDYQRYVEVFSTPPSQDRKIPLARFTAVEQLVELGLVSA